MLYEVITNRRGALLSITGATAVVGILFAYGAAKTPSDRRGHPGPAVRVGIAQGGIDQSVKWDPDHQKSTLDIYGTLTREAVEKGAEVVVWPETAAPFFRNNFV